MKRIIIITLLAAILLCGCAKEAAIPKLEIIFFDVGKADSFFMQSGGDTLLMDAGKVDDGEYVAEQLRKMGIQTIDHFVITHFDLTLKRDIASSVGARTVLKPISSFILSYVFFAYLYLSVPFSHNTRKLRGDRSFLVIFL